MSPGNDRGAPREESAVADQVTTTCNQYGRGPQVLPSPRPWSRPAGQRERYLAGRRKEVLADGRRDPCAHRRTKFVVPARCPFGLTEMQFEAEHAALAQMGIPSAEIAVMIGAAVGIAA